MFSTSLRKKFKIGGYIVSKISVCIDESEYFKFFPLFPLSDFVNDVLRFINKEFLYMCRVEFTGVVEYKFSNIKLFFFNISFDNNIYIRYNIKYDKNGLLHYIGYVVFTLRKCKSCN